MVFEQDTQDTRRVVVRDGALDWLGAEHQHKFTLLAVSVSLDPRLCIGKSYARDLFELLRELPCNDQFAIRTECRREILDTFEDAVRRFIEDHWAGRVDGGDRLSTCACR